MAEALKIVFIVCDGMGDRPVVELGGRTPLEAAETPWMNMLALRGENGIVDVIAPGVRPGSDTGHLAVLGYDPYEYYTGRGPFEAMGVGLELIPGDIAFRLNFATVEERGGKLIVLDRRAGRITERTDELARAVNGLEIKKLRFFVKESTAHRAALVVRGEGAGHAVTDVDPHETGVQILKAEGKGEADALTARAVNEFVRRTYEILSAHPVNVERMERGEPPANILLPRGAGLAPEVPPFGDRYGMTGAAAAEVGLIRGIARYVGLDVLGLSDAVTGGLGSDFQALFENALSALGAVDFLLVNAKGPDVAGHDGDVAAKVAVIERIDAALGPFVKEVSGNVIALLADHSTPCAVRDHSGDPVPFVLSGPGVRVDDVTTFGERNAARGGAGRLRGTDVLPMAMQLAGRSHKFGA